eukprot:CAMPEP_0184645092 /NCGR_PEP_ID=MMETSP0308-20130426/1643_1 /TAXON_ID=38269 /ORGANISM="Gloeochaete witrockiana, Strain SAG 46.84" /LENGTH=387 /DNA_ID=CAMNT_0027073911 /DNA_START=31 /DNA_END=1195 /DNA_ORIENTATION=-
MRPEAAASSHFTGAKPNVVVGMSGGVDSSVAAHLLKEQGFNVIGMFMRNWDEREERGICTADAEYADVQRVCSLLDIECRQVDFVKEYWNLVFTKLLDGVRRGLTPNPDVLCNRDIKFDSFIQRARDLNADYIATGHYARLQKNYCEDGSVSSVRLLRGKDLEKDQSYFLASVPSKALSQVLFPIGDMCKSDVRSLAQSLGLPVWNKRSSRGLCFVGKRDFPGFLSSYIQHQPGPFVSVDGEIIGQHKGLAAYTIGQGARIGGASDRWFVVSKDVASNSITVALGHRHPALYYDSMIVSDLFWSDQRPQEGKYEYQIRYRQPIGRCHIRFSDTDVLEADFTEPQRAVTPGQVLVLYDGDVCLGGGIIQRAGQSYYEQKKPVGERFID